MTSEANPHYFATNTKDDTSIDQITDAVDFPHTGLIKSLSLGMKGNYAVKGSATDFDITQSATSSSVVVVKSGKIFRDGALHTVPSNGADTTFANTSFQATANTHHLLVADSSNVLQIRKHGSSTQNAIPPYTEGDTIIAVITYTSDGFNDMTVQYLTTSKVANNVSIGYGTSAYTEAMSIEGSATKTTFHNKIADADVRFVLGDNTADEKFEIVTDDDADGDLTDTVTEVFSVTGSKVLTCGSLSYDQEDLVLSSAAAQLKVIDTTNNYAITVKGGGGPRLQFGDTDSSLDSFMDMGAYGGMNNIDTQSRDFRIHGNTDANHFYIDESASAVGIGTTSPDANAKLSVEGAISLDEISAPSNTADRGQLYTNADNHLHFINGAGTDVKVTEEVFIVALSDETTDLTTGTGKASFHMPFAMTLTGVKANCTTAPAGATIIVDINEAGSTILSTKLSIDASETTSATAASAAVISDTALADDALITFDIDQVGSSTAGKGLKVTLYGYRA